MTMPDSAPTRLRQGCASAARTDGQPMTEADWDAVYAHANQPLLGCDVDRDEDGAPGSIGPAGTLMLVAAVLLVAAAIWVLQ
jgi:hypothetical protein